MKFGASTARPPTDTVVAFTVEWTVVTLPATSVTVTETGKRPSSLSVAVSVASTPSTEPSSLTSH